MNRALRFSLLFKDVPSLVANPRDMMSRFMTRMSDIVEEKFYAAMLHNYMDIPHSWYLTKK